MTENEIGTACISAAITVHRELGSGLLESVYEHALMHELTSRGLWVERQVPISITYKVEEINNAHRKQLLTYLRLSGLKLGYLLNFGAELMRQGIVRTANGLDENRAGRDAKIYQ